MKDAKIYVVQYGFDSYVVGDKAAFTDAEATRINGKAPPEQPFVQLVGPADAAPATAPSRNRAAAGASSTR